MTPTSEAAEARWSSGPAHLAVAADRPEPFAELPSRFVQRPTGCPGLDLHGRRRRQQDDRKRRRRVQDGHDPEHDRGACQGHQQGSEEREAHRERRLEREVEHAHRRLELVLGHDARDHRCLGRGEDHGRQADPEVQDEEQRHVRSRERQPQRDDGPHDIRHEHRQPDIEPVDEDAAGGRQQRRGDEERQDEGADRGVRAGRVEDQDRQRVQRHVAADLGRRLDEPEAGELRVAQDRNGSLGGHRTYCATAAAPDLPGWMPGPLSVTPRGRSPRSARPRSG